MNGEDSPCFFGIGVEDGQIQASYEITNICNLECRHCCNESSNKGFSGLPIESIQKLLAELKESRVKSLYLTGGEPALHPNFDKIMETSYSLGYQPMVASNGMDIIDSINIIKKYASTNGGVFLSLDGMGATHDSFRSKRNAFEKVVKSAKALKKANVPVRFSTVLWKDNKDQIGQLYELAKELGAYQIHFTGLVEAGRAKNDSISLNKIEYAKCAKEVMELAKGNFKEVCQISMRRVKKLCSNSERCLAGERIIHIDCEGFISPCSWVAKSGLRNAYTKKWNSGNLNDCLKMVREFGRLVDRRIEKHGYSGCPAIAILTTNDKYATDPINEILQEDSIEK